jgi:hypothetical protein
MKRFLIRAILFLSLLITLLVAMELSIARANHKTHGQFRIGAEVYRAIETAQTPHPELTTLYLGDSVAHQLFPVHTEPSPKLLYLSTNQAISVAGQYCLLQKVIETSPHLRHVYLFYTPRSWSNDLDQIFTHDYFCGYFHSPALVWEIWQLKHDTQLTESHFARLILPNIMAENSYLNRSQSNYNVPLVKVDSADAHPFSQTSRRFLSKMKALCERRQITLAVLPCPCMGNPSQFAALDQIYNAPIRFYDPDLFLPDLIHFKKPNVQPMRERVIEEFHLRTND